jgi:2-polyprenyl-3-methyl-5-hydroxy-6-metoxy-1,4-benzoquinol methylase
MLLETIRRNRALLAHEMGRSRYQDLSAVTRSRIDVTEALIAAHARGRVLDVGCGHMPFRESVLRYADSYEGLDIEARVDGVAYISDAVRMTGVPRGAFDTVLCLEVLEHVPDPRGVLDSVAQVLRPGGVLILTVPHLSRLHEEPHDYYRYTGYGLRALSTAAGLEVVAITSHAGVLSFLTHQLSTVIVGLSWGIPGLRQVAYAINKLVLVRPSLWLDRVLELGRFFPLGYSLVARRPQ